MAVRESDLCPKNKSKRPNPFDFSAGMELIEMVAKRISRHPFESRLARQMIAYPVPGRYAITNAVEVFGRKMRAACVHLGNPKHEIRNCSSGWKH
ncbi:MAG: hypothetical protein EA424_18315 [Planctomycetaceae bacterium]|nr:MAG: hypothetical protein EA424_18315 [Planctomycetaceae bacterium]